MTEPQPPVANIKLDLEYESLLFEFGNYMRDSDLSRAALQCTQKVIEINEGHYTAWSYRRRILAALNDDSYKEELEFICEFTNETPKNYQLWQHRQMIIERMGAAVAAEDLEATKVHLSLDSKNIHCWQHRQWILRHFQFPVEDELKYTEDLLAQDVYNNSVWNHRMFLIKASFYFQNDNVACFKEEFERILMFLSERTEDNECFWNYLAALYNELQFMPLNQMIEALSLKIEAPNSSNNYLFLRFLSRFTSGTELKSICERLKVLHPINKSYWTAIQ